MLRTRLIPVLLLKNGLLVRSEAFSIHQIIGNPLYEVQRFNEWNVDELIYLDITKEGEYDLGRDDHKTKGFTNPLEILELVAKTCFMPLTWGGRIRTVQDMRDRFSRGADKITLNTAALENPDLIGLGAKVFGNQALVLSIDVKKSADGNYEVMAGGGHTPTGRKVIDWAVEVAERGAGEILLQSVDEDGMGNGYDLSLIRSVAAAVSIP